MSLWTEEHDLATFVSKLWYKGGSIKSEESGQVEESESCCRACTIFLNLIWRCVFFLLLFFINTTPPPPPLNISFYLKDLG